MHILHAPLALARRYQKFFLYLIAVAAVKTYSALPVNWLLSHRVLNSVSRFHRWCIFCQRLIRHFDSFDPENECTDPYHVLFFDTEVFTGCDPERWKWGQFQLTATAVLLLNREKLVDVFLILELTQRVLTVDCLVFETYFHDSRRRCIVTC